MATGRGRPTTHRTSAQQSCRLAGDVGRAGAPARQSASHQTIDRIAAQRNRVGGVGEPISAKGCQTWKSRVRFGGESVRAQIATVAPAVAAAGQTDTDDYTTRIV